MEISNLFTLVGVFVTVAAHLIIVSSKISRFMGKTEQTLENLKEQLVTVGSICANCYLKVRIEKVEKKQEQLRDELPERLAKIESDIGHIKEILEASSHCRAGRHDRTGDL